MSPRALMGLSSCYFQILSTVPCLLSVPRDGSGGGDKKGMGQLDKAQSRLETSGYISIADASRGRCSSTMTRIRTVLPVLCLKASPSSGPCVCLQGPLHPRSTTPGGKERGKGQGSPNSHSHRARPLVAVARGCVQPQPPAHLGRQVWVWGGF